MRRSARAPRTPRPGADPDPAEVGQQRGDGALPGVDRGPLTLVAGDHQAARVRVAPDRGRVGQVDRGLGLVGEPEHGRKQPRLGQGAHRGGTVGERRPAPALVDLHRRQRPHPDGDRGDHPESALGAEQQLAQVGAGRAGGRAAEIQAAARGGHRQGDDQGVEPAEAGARLPAGPGGREAADRGVLEGLRVVPERQSLGGEQRLGLGPAQARLEGGGHRDVVDGQQSLHPHQVETEHPREALASGDQAPGDRRTAPEGHDGQVVLHRDGEDRGHLVVAAGADDGVRCVLEIAGPGPEQVGGGLAAGAQPSGLVVGADLIGPDDVGEPAQHRVVQRVGRQHGAGASADRSSIPKTASTSPRAASGSGCARAGSPQRDGCISVCWSMGDVGCMRYTVTHDVTSSQRRPRTAGRAASSTTSTRPAPASSTSAGGAPP